MTATPSCSFEKKRVKKKKKLGGNVGSPEYTGDVQTRVQASAFMAEPRVYELVCGVRSTPPVFPAACLLVQALKIQKKKKKKKAGAGGYGGVGSRRRKKK